MQKMIPARLLPYIHNNMFSFTLSLFRPLNILRLRACNVTWNATTAAIKFNLCINLLHIVCKTLSSVTCIRCHQVCICSTVFHFEAQTKSNESIVNRWRRSFFFSTLRFWISKRSCSFHLKRYSFGVDITVERIVFDTTNSEAASKQIYCFCTAAAAMAAFCSLFGLSGTMLFVVTFYATRHQIHFLLLPRLRRMIFCVHNTFPFINLYTQTQCTNWFFIQSTFFNRNRYILCVIIEALTPCPHHHRSFQWKQIFCRKKNAINCLRTMHNSLFMLALWFLSISQDTNQSTNWSSMTLWFLVQIFLWYSVHDFCLTSANVNNDKCVQRVHCTAYRWIENFNENKCCCFLLITQTKCNNSDFFFSDFHITHFRMFTFSGEGMNKNKNAAAHFENVKFNEKNNNRAFVPIPIEWRLLIYLSIVSLVWRIQITCSWAHLHLFVHSHHCAICFSAWNKQTKYLYSCHSILLNVPIGNRWSTRMDKWTYHWWLSFFDSVTGNEFDEYEVDW